MQFHYQFPALKQNVLSRSKQTTKIARWNSLANDLWLWRQMASRHQVLSRLVSMGFLFGERRTQVAQPLELLFNFDDKRIGGVVVEIGVVDHQTGGR